MNSIQNNSNYESHVKKNTSKAGFLDEIQTKEFSLLFTAISTALLEIYISQPLTVSTVQLMYTVKRMEENLIENHAPFLWFKKSIQNPQV